MLSHCSCQFYQIAQIFLHLKKKKNAQKENETEEANSERAAPRTSSYCIHSRMRRVLIFKETIAVFSVFLQAGCLWLALTLIHILLLGMTPLLPFPLPLWHSPSCRLSLSRCFPVLGAGSMASICLSCVHALFPMSERAEVVPAISHNPTKSQLI